MDKKKIIAIIIAAVLAVALIVIGIVLIVGKTKDSGSDKGGKDDVSYVDLGDEYKVETDDKTEYNDDKGYTGKTNVTASANKTVKVPVIIENNPGLCAGELHLEYDKKALTLVEVENTGIIDDAYNNGDIIIFIDSELKDTTKNGAYLMLEFSVNKDAAKGTYEIKLGKESTLTNFNEEDVKADITIGKITVK